MAVIGVALAPQVMKWVGNARKANDKQTIESIISSAQIAAANAGKDLKTMKLTYTDRDDIWAISNSSTISETELGTAMNNVLGSGQTKIKLQSNGDSDVILEYSGGVVTMSGITLDLDVTP